jgi:hypothetical protein
MDNIHSFADDMQVITRALLTAAEAANAFDEMTARMMQWNASGVYPSNKEVAAALTQADYAASSAKTMASRILAWAKAGKTPKTLHECVNKTPDGHVKGKGGRKAGQGKGKSTKPENDDAGVDEAVAALPNDDRAWRVFIEGMRSKVNGRKEWPSDRIVAFQECCATMIALLKSK